MCISPWCKKLKYEWINIPRYLLQNSKKNTETITQSWNNHRIPVSECSVVQQQFETTSVQNNRKFFKSADQHGADKNNVVQYLGIAIDEPERLARLDGVTKVSPLAAIGWTEADCRKWCEENDLLSPIYETSQRGGCWFCHNQGVDQLRLLRKNYPDLWALLMKWDLDSPVSFHADGHTVHDFDRRFQFEDADLVPTDRRFRWKMLNDPERINRLMMSTG